MKTVNLFHTTNASRHIYGWRIPPDTVGAIAFGFQDDRDDQKSTPNKLCQLMFIKLVGTSR